MIDFPNVPDITFTFHYVYIYIIDLSNRSGITFTFTFHYVYIYIVELLILF